MAVETLKPGTIVYFSEGCYSGYGVMGMARVLKPFAKKVFEEMVAACTHPPEYDKEGDPRFHSEEAMPWFLKNGYIEEIEYQELYLGDYSFDTPRWEDA